MKQFIALFLLLGMAGAGAVRSEENCAARNGDVNADGAVDVSDGIAVFGHLFLGDPYQLPALCPAPVALPDTGQTLCYDTSGGVIDCASETWPGQDGFYEIGCPPEGRFIDNGDGTVMDTCTGLMWSGKTADINADGRITPSIPGNPGPDGASWQEALKYCEELQFAGYSDWRLPNVRELESLAVYVARHPQASTDPVFDAEIAHYWTSTSLVLDTAMAIVVSFVACSELYHESKENRFFVRAVRNGCAVRNGDANADGTVDLSDGITVLGYLFLGDPARFPALCPGASGLPDTGQTLCYDGEGKVIDCGSNEWPGQDGFYRTGCPAAGRFIDGDDTVTDTCTGLMWQKSSADTGGNAGFTADDVATWQEALQYCDGLVLAGHSDWRLPSARELESIVEYGRVDPCIDPVFEAESMRYWTSSSLVPAGDRGDTPEAAGFVDFWYGSRMYHGTKTRRWLVRAVRNSSAYP